MRRLIQLTALVALSLTAGATALAVEDPALTPPLSPGFAQLEPRTQAFVDALAAQGRPPLYMLPVLQARAVLETLQSGAVALLPADVEDHVLPVGPKGSVGIRIVRPQGSSEVLPVVVYFHGGGWILGSEKTHDRLIREIATGANAAVVFVKYTPSPEAQFPVPLEEAYAATRYIAENGASFNLDPSRLAVVGDSVGGNMATVVARLAKERGGPAIRAQVLFYPVTDTNLNTASYLRFAGGPWLTRPAMEWFFKAYAPRLIDRLSPDVAPLRASVEQLRGVPRALVIIDENDVLRDEVEAYAHKLMRADVPVKAVRVLGTIHDFVMLNALADTPPARTAITLANDELREVLTR